MTNRGYLCRLPAAVIFLVVAATGTRAFAQALPPETTHGEILLNFWKPAPDLVVQNVDFVEPLGIEDTRFTELRVTGRPGRKHKLRFSYLPMRYSEEGTIVETTIVFKGQTYSVNAPVNYEFKWELYRFGYEWDAIYSDRAYLGLVAELKYNRVHTFLASIGTSTDILTEVPLPTIGGIGRVYLGDYVSVTGELTGIDVHFDDKRGKFYDLDIYGQVNFSRSFAGQVGYRRLDVDYRWDGDEGTFLMEGIYFGGTVRF